MKNILKDISTIDSGLLQLQDLLKKTDAFRVANEQDIASKNQNADTVYQQEIQSIEASQRSAEAACTKTLADYKQKRAEIAQKYQKLYRDAEARIINRCDAVIAGNRNLIDWINTTLSELPPKTVKKILAGPVICPEKKNASDLNDLYRMISDPSFPATVNRTLHLKGYSSKSGMTRRFVTDAVAYKLYLENEIKAISAKKTVGIKQELQRTENAKQKALAAIALLEQKALEDKRQAFLGFDRQKKQASDKKQATLANINALKQKHAQGLNAKKADFVKKYNSFFQSDLIVSFMDRTKKRLEGTGALASDFANYDPLTVCDRYSIGDFLVPVKASHPKFLSDLQSKLPSIFKSGYFRVPLLLNNRATAKFLIHYASFDKALVCGFVQNIVLQKLRCTAAGNIDIYFAEPDKSGQILGPLSARVQENEAIGIYSINSKASIKDTLKSVSAEIDEITGILGNYQNIYAYNADNTPAIKEKCIVLSDVAGVIDKEDWELLKVIWNNAERCGINLIVISEHPIDRIAALYPHSNVDVNFLNSADLYLVKCIQNKCSIRHGKNEFHFLLGKMNDAKKAFIDTYREEAKNSQRVDNRFSSHFDARTEYPYKDGTNALALPVMLHNYPGGSMVDFVMDSKTRAHTLLTGGIGAGKTTFLHMIISSIVMNYHPDDVELWLVDYGIVSFKKYVEKRPPHVRFIALEKTEEFTYSFLEYVKAYFSNRERIFKKSNVESIEDYRKLHGPLSMPRIVLIIDEFHVMPQHTKNSPAHNTILENILREYRKFGLSCIFSDQTFNTGLREDGVKQISNRISMRQQKVGDITETLGVSKDNYTQEMLHRMERTEQSELWCKEYNRDSASDFSIENFKAIYAPEDALQTVLDTSINRNDVVKNDTNVYIIDGKDRKPMDLRKVSDEILAASRAAELRLCMGVPTSIEPYFSFELERRYGNNILIAGRNAGISNDVLMEILLSASMSQNARVMVLADSRDPSLEYVRQGIQKWRLGSKVEVYSEYPEICREVKKLYERIKARETLTKPTLVLWLGLLDIYDELSIYSTAPEGELRDSETQTGFELRDDKAQEACRDEELLNMAREFGLSVEELLQNLAVTGEEQTIEAPKEDPLLYNAMPNVFDLFSLGGRYSLYHAVVVESASSMKRMKEFKTDQFLHRIAYAMSGEDAMDFGLGRKIGGITDEEMALYTNGVKTSMFRPFLMDETDD